jgi:hypothetical protein
MCVFVTSCTWPKNDGRSLSSPCNVTDKSAPRKECSSSLVMFTSAISCSSLSRVLEISRNASSSSDGNSEKSLLSSGVSDSVKADLLGVLDEGLEDGLEVVPDDGLEGGREGGLEAGLEDSLEVGLEDGLEVGLDVDSDKWLLSSSIQCWLG